MNSQEITYLGAFIAGLMSFLSPCVLPLIPSYITYITGLSFSDLQSEHPPARIRRKTLTHSACFVAGFSLIFILLGATATLVGTLLQQHTELLRKAGGVMIFMFGLHIAGLLPIRLLMGEKRISLHSKPAGLFGSFLVGIVFAAGWTPCIGPVLGSILTLAATEQDVEQGVSLLLFYSAGMGLPFLLSSLALHRFLVLFHRFRKHIRLAEIMAGIMLMVSGVMIYFNWLARLSGYALNLLGEYR